MLDFWICPAAQGEANEKWKDMGWQGKDPATDFRGAGFLALENLIWFARAHPTTFDQLLNKAEGRRADPEYPFAAAGCNITFKILVGGSGTCMYMCMYLYNNKQGGPLESVVGVLQDICDLRDSARDPDTPYGRAFLRLMNDSPVAFEAIYAETFKTLDRVWLERGATYLEFPSVLEAAIESIKTRLNEGYDFRADISDPPDPLPNLTDSHGSLLIEDMAASTSNADETAQPTPESPQLIDFRNTDADFVVV